MPTQTYNWGLTDMPITLEQNATLKHINIRKEGPADDTALNNLLAEGQAREKVLRDALDNVLLNATAHFPEPMLEMVEDALAQPVEDTALNNMILFERMDAIRTYKTMREKLMLKDMLKTERERCAKVIEGQDVDPAIKRRMSFAIRALVDQDD